MLTYIETIEYFTKLATEKTALLRKNPFGFLIGALFAGAYVGIGVILIFSVGQAADPALRPLLMGLSFGIALTLVVFAGSELFTGYTMYMTLGRLSGAVTLRSLVATWIVSWVGNLIGSMLLALLFVNGGGGQILKHDATLLFDVASYKMNSAPLALFSRAILCNWLVCLAIWMSARTKSDSAKCILIFWCLFAFISSGFEHSVANMTLFSIALLADHPATISVEGMVHNLFWVTLGNAVSGAVFVALGYWCIAKPAGSMTAETVSSSQEI